MPSTNARIRSRFDDGKLLNDGGLLNVVDDEPANNADTVVGEGTDVHAVHPDGTNSVDLDAVAERGRVVHIIHAAGDNTPTVAFADADFVADGPNDITNAGGSATVVNITGESSGWVVLAEV